MPASAAKPQPVRLSLGAVSDRDLARHLLTFDADVPSTYSAHTLPMAEAAHAAARSPIPWPEGRAPKAAPLPAPPSAAAPLSQHDYLIVTWTVEEAKCLADVLTPGYPSKTAWYPYTHNFEAGFVPNIRKGAPALASERLGSWFPTVIAGKSVMCFKSELHFSQDGPKLPVANLWKQLIQEVRPKIVITTGTAGGVGPAVELGDVVVARMVRFDCTKEFADAGFRSASYACSKLALPSQAEAEKLFHANLQHLPAGKRPPQIFTGPLKDMVKLDSVVTTDFFAYDDTDDTFGLQSLGAAVEMGDAVLGMAIQELGGAAPQWIAVRNASDPEMNTQGLTPKEVRAKAAQIYERFGYWTTICSAIACWALVLDN